MKVIKIKYNFVCFTLALIVCMVSPMFTMAAATEIFIDSGQSLGNSDSLQVKLGDLDGDSDIDAFIGNGINQPNTVWLNNGAGVFTSNSQKLGNFWSWGLDLGDVDGDGDLDAFVANYAYGQPNKVWFNDGNGNFTDSGQNLGDSWSLDVALGDLDGDGDLDAFVANYQPNKVWLNDGNGNFTDSGQNFDWIISQVVTLGDIDGDGDPDAFVGNHEWGSGAPNQVWLNDGNGNFTDSGQRLGNSCTEEVALGDVDGDGHIDFFVANACNQPDTVWLNNGTGFFSLYQSLGSSESRGAALGDIDRDGDLDAFVTIPIPLNQPNTVWLNDGTGAFDLVQSLGSSHSDDVALGDVDNDGDLDAFIANYDGGQSNKVWINITKRFADVPPGYWAEDAIYKIYEAGITKGCSQDPLKFCPEKTVNRDQMAVFLGRATHGSNFIPPDATGIFADVPTWYWAADWIEQFYADGLTKGCKVDPHDVQSPLMYYCPKYPVTRTTMAIFLLRAKHGANYEPPPAIGIFEDVGVNYWAADWIEQLYREGITKGCKQNPLMYCPANHVTRAQMAVFLTRMLGLTLDDGLKAYYPFNGNAIDETGHGYDGTVLGATPTEDRNGVPASAYAFDGQNDYINLGTSLNVPSWANYAVSLWFLHDGGGTTAQGYGQQILDKSTWYEDFHLQIQTQEVSSGELKYWTNYHSGGFGTSIIDPRDFRDNQWHHVVINKQGTDGALWVDGVESATTSEVWTVYNNQPMLVGYTFHGDFYQQQHFSGKVDDIRFYNRVLKQPEIKALYNLDK